MKVIVTNHAGEDSEFDNADGVQATPTGILGVLDRDGEPIALFAPGFWTMARTVESSIVQFPQVMQ